MILSTWKNSIVRLPFGKRLPAAVYFVRLPDGSWLPQELAATIQRAEKAACPAPDWTLLKLHTDQMVVLGRCLRAFRQSSDCSLDHFRSCNLFVEANSLHMDLRQVSIQAEALPFMIEAGQCVKICKLRRPISSLGELARRVYYALFSGLGMKRQHELHAFWLGKLANLNAARTAGQGTAPHKPLMLFSVMDLVEMGVLGDRWVPYSADLVTRFRDYWGHVVERRKNLPEITMPFNALGGQRDAVWERFDEHGNPSRSKLTTRRCRLDADLFDCLVDPGFRKSARLVLIATYFTPAEQVSLCARFGLAVPDSAEMAAFRQDREAFKKSQKKGRNIRFRADVSAGYKYTCALTGYCLHSTVGYIVQACHIHEHARSGNDQPGNGLALSPDAHWMFDKGLWTVVTKGDELLIKVAVGRFTESSQHGHLLATYDGSPVYFHAESCLRPALEHLEWHRKHHRI